MRAVRRQLDKMDAAFRPSEKGPEVRAFVVGGIVPDDVDQSLVGIVRLDLGKNLRGADPVDGDWFDEGGVEVFKVERAKDVHAVSSCRGRDRGV